MAAVADAGRVAPVSDTLALPDFAAIRAAQVQIESHVRRTPVLTCAALDELVGAALYFKCENFQAVGAFKARGASNAVFSLSAEDAARGVVTHSSGNHGAALAYAAQRRGIPAFVVMPRNAAKVKQTNVAHFGAIVRLSEPTQAAREQACADVARETGASLVHPYDDVQVIAGQGTAMLELLTEVPALDIVMAPIGGGGLLAGSAIAAHGIHPGIVVYGAEPLGADDAARSFTSGKVELLPHPATIADGLRATLSARTLAALRAHVSAIGTATEEGIIRAMRMTWEHMKIVIEPSSAVPLACLLEGALAVRGKRVGIIITGGNVDLDRLPWQ
jgi:threonine dehydratase